MNHQYKKTFGFTIIELVLAMGFISLLLLAIAMLTIYISTIYNQGITLREVNQTGLAISEDVQRTLGVATPFVIDPLKDSSHYKFTAGGGRLCVGSHSYAWNYLATEDDIPPMNAYSSGNGEDKPSFVKVVDPDNSLCRHPEESINRDDANELLSVGDRNLVMYDFTISSPLDISLSSGQALYAIDFTIGTKGSDLVNATNKTCRPPSESERSREFCAVNQFSIIVRAGSEAGGN